MGYKRQVLNAVAHPPATAAPTLTDKATATAVEDASMLADSRASRVIEPSVENSKARSVKASTVLRMLLSDSDTLTATDTPVAPKDAATETANTEDEMLPRSRAMHSMSPSLLKPRSAVLAT